VAGRRYSSIHKLIPQKCHKRNIVSCRQAGDILWGLVTTAAIRDSTLPGFYAKFNSPPNCSYQPFHLVLDSLIIDVLKKAAESRQNAILNSDDEQEEDAESANSVLGAERVIACP